MDCGITLPVRTRTCTYEEKEEQEKEQLARDVHQP